MKYFTLEELTKSATASRLGIKNKPNTEEKSCLVKLVDNILDPLRKNYGRPIIVTSGFRCEKLNQAVGGAKLSQHRLGQAADIRSVSDKRADNKELFDLIIAMGLPFDQLINEYGYDWVHVSYGQRQRRQILDAKRVGSKTTYTTHKL